MSLIKHLFSKQFIFFIIVGCFNTFNGVLFSTLFNLFLSATLAFVIGYACSLVVSYLLNSKFVFKQSLAINRFIKFVLSYIPNFVIQFFCVASLLQLLNVKPFIVYFISAAIGVPITYLIMKLFAFKK